MEQLEICNIWRTKCILNLRLGEFICPICRGMGGQFVSVHFRDKQYYISQCPICKGAGKVDWVTNVKYRPLSYYATRAAKYIKVKCPRNRKCKVLRKYWKEHNHKKKYEIKVSPKPLY